MFTQSFKHNCSSKEHGCSLKEQVEGEHVNVLLQGATMFPLGVISLKEQPKHAPS